MARDSRKVEARGSTPLPSTQSRNREEARDFIRRRYANGRALPFGEGAILRARFNLSKSTFYRIITEFGCRILSAKESRPCYVCGCGEPVGSLTVCEACRWVWLPCQFCYRPVRRLVSRLTGRNTVTNLGPKNKKGERNTLTYQGGAFCSHACQIREVTRKKRIGNG